MPIELDKVPAARSLPMAPRISFWIAALLILVLLSCFLAWMFEHQLDISATRFWWVVLGGPSLIWSTLVLSTLSFFIARLGAVESWNEMREADLVQRMLLGRRSLPILAVGLHTALSSDDTAKDNGHTAALLAGKQAVRFQPGWSATELGFRHSRLD
jgi:hypothetical protein